MITTEGCRFAAATPPGSAQAPPVPWCSPMRFHPPLPRETSTSKPSASARTSAASSCSSPMAARNSITTTGCRKSVEAAFVDERKAIHWYDGQSPGLGSAGDDPSEGVWKAAGTGGRIHDSLGDASAPEIFAITTDLRRRKDPDEVEQTSGVHGRRPTPDMPGARANVKPGNERTRCVRPAVCQAVLRCGRSLGRGLRRLHGSRPAVRNAGGPPTPHVLQAGETFILDYSVILQGYRSDFTNTLVVGGNPMAEQRKIFELCTKCDGSRRNAN